MSVLGSTWRSIWRFHRVLAGILVLEYALTFAIMLVTSGMLVARAAAIHQDSGLEEHGLYVVLGDGVGQQLLHRSQWLEAAARLQAVAGRDQVAFGSSLPFLGSGSQMLPISAASDPDHATQVQGSAYQGNEHFATVLGLTRRQGRDFQAEDIALRYGDTSHLVMLSEGLAQRLFHEQTAVGKQVSIAGQLATVIGVTSPLAAPTYAGASQSELTFLRPEFPSGFTLLVVRHDGPASALTQVIKSLNKTDAGAAHWELTPYAQIRADYFAADRDAVATLAAVMGVVLVIALCGILGLTNYWVSRRRRQIATRRALGARKQDIRLHYLGESGLLVVTGLALGLLLDLLFSVKFGMFHLDMGLSVLLLAMTLMLLLVGIVVSISLRRWLRMNPVELMRSI